MQQTNLLKRIFHLYYDGFRSMTLGRTLWLIIGIKLVIIFVVLRLLFFHDYVGEHAEAGAESDFVATEVMERAATAE